MRSDRDRLVELAERCLAEPAVQGRLRVIHPPTSGVVMLQVREPVCRERFYLGEVVVTRCEVAIAECRGWAMIAGEHEKAALAAAVCDCVSRTSEPALAALREAVDKLCDETDERLSAEHLAEWSTLAPTRVAFEEFE